MNILLLAVVLAQDVTIDAKELPYKHTLSVPGPGAVQLVVVEGPRDIALKAVFPDGIVASAAEGQARVTEAASLPVVVGSRYGTKYEGKLVFRFDFTPETDASEPNDDRERARRIEPGEHKVAIFPKGDADVLVFEAPDAGYVTVTAPDPPKGLTLKAEVTDEAGRSLGFDHVRIDVSGRYFVRLSDRYGTFAGTPASFSVHVRLLPEDDALEPNDSAETATRIDIGAWYSASIQPASDVDYFEVVVTAPGTLTPKVQSNVAGLKWACVDEGGNAVTGIPFAVQPGRYRIAVSGSACPPFEFAIAHAAVIDELEPNDETPVEIEPGRLYRVSLARPGDVDRFRVKVPGPGLLSMHVVGSAPANIIFTCESAKGEYVERRVAGPVDVEMHAKGGASPHPFYVTAEWRADEAGEPNNSRETATKLEFGAAAELRLWPAGDEDWYRVEAPGPGHLVALLHSGALEHMQRGLVTFVEVYDAEGKLMAQLGWDAQGGYRRTIKIEAAGPLFLRVPAAKGASLEPFHLTAHFLADGATAKSGGAGGLVVYVLGLEADDRLTPELKLLAHTAHGAFLAAAKVEEIAPKLEEAVKRATAEVEKRREEERRASTAPAPARRGSLVWFIVPPIVLVGAVLVWLVRRRA